MEASGQLWEYMERQAFEALLELKQRACVIVLRNARADNCQVCFGAQHLETASGHQPYAHERQHRCLLSSNRRMVIVHIGVKLVDGRRAESRLK